jgi:catechol 2,3-dioxygenase-like lactoylglutathione lyase family enzyme
MDLRLEVVVLPVSDVDRAKNFYQGLGRREDADLATGPDPNWPDWYATYLVDEQTGQTAGS